MAESHGGKSTTFMENAAHHTLEKFNKNSGSGRIHRSINMIVEILFILNFKIFLG